MSVQIEVQGAAPHANDPHQATATMHGIPRVGDQISVWDGNGEVYIEVGAVTWPAWRYDHDADQAPTLWLERPEDSSDEEWSDVFAAIKEARRP